MRRIVRQIAAGLLALFAVSAFSGCVIVPDHGDYHHDYGYWRR